MIMKIRLQNCLWVILWLLFVLQDAAAGTRPTAEKTVSSVSDANLMFEILLGGVEIDRDNNIVLLDAELASMRHGRAFLSQINDDIPRSVSSMLHMVTTLEGERRGRPLAQDQFDSLVLSMVYSAQQAWHQERNEEQKDWSEVFLQLANITVYELRGSHLFSYA
ncbi:protein FAM180B [Anoplopoma fimbria]|uniref:protein FAM180B n=1 Tax=Anoplopoma fimbria TaxID=229290 RepID=UPI0023EC6551|nr:protein FAM180B [Anoplopoma fimbria]